MRQFINVELYKKYDTKHHNYLKTQFDNIKTCKCVRSVQKKRKSEMLSMLT